MQSLSLSTRNILIMKSLCHYKLKFHIKWFYLSKICPQAVSNSYETIFLIFRTYKTFIIREDNFFFFFFERIIFFYCWKTIWGLSAQYLLTYHIEIMTDLKGWIWARPQRFSDVYVKNVEKKKCAMNKEICYRIKKFAGSVC